MNTRSCITIIPDFPNQLALPLSTEAFKNKVMLKKFKKKKAIPLPHSSVNSRPHISEKF